MSNPPLTLVRTRRQWLRALAGGAVALALVGSTAGAADAFGPLEPVAIVTATPTTGEAPLVVTFDGSTSTGPNPLTSWAWNFGDGTTGTGSIVSHAYASAGTYTATLVVSDGLGLFSFPRAVEIVVTAPTKPTAPTGLTAATRSRTSIALAWTNTATNATSIRIERCKGATCTNFVRVATVAPSSNSFTNTGLVRNTVYRYRVRAVNAVGSSVTAAVSARTAR